MDILLAQCAGFDVHKKTILACALTVSPEGKIAKEIREYRTMTRDILNLADWLAGLQVTHVAMESTGVFWKPIYNLLEGRFEILLVNAQHIKQVPGRKTDVRDCEWIARCLQHGLLRASFVPARPLRDLRDLLRHRAQLSSEKTREANRIHKILEDANIKLGAVASDILGVSGRDMIRAIVAGEQDSSRLAELARRKLRGKIPELRVALEGNAMEHHRFMLKMHMEHVEYIESQIELITQRVEQLMAPQQSPKRPSNPPAASKPASETPLQFQEAVELLEKVPGCDRTVIENILAETGLDMSRFPSAAHISSWTGVCPGNNESAGKRRSGKTSKGSRWLRRSLCQAAWASARSAGSYFSEQYRRIAARRGKKRAIMAVAHSLLVTIYHMLKTRTPYRELGSNWFDQLNPEKLTRYLVKRLEALGHKVTLGQFDAEPTLMA
jgi:transposase